MKKLINYINNTKLLSLFISSLVLFIFLAGGRIYIYNNINTSVNMIRLGAEWLNISLLSSVLFTIGIIIGIAAAFILRKKVTPFVNKLFNVISALFVFVTLLLTPYNLQLLLPNQNLQNITSIALIAVIVFQTISSAILTLSLCLHFMQIVRKNLNGFKASLIVIGTAILIAVLTVVLNWSFSSTVGISAIILAILNAVHSLFMLGTDKFNNNEVITLNKKKLLLIIVIYFVSLSAMILLGYFYAESFVKM